MNHWLIIYDICNEKRLQKVAKLLENYGTRVQKSVFEIEAGKDTISRIIRKVRRVIEKTEDFVVYFNICDRDWQKSIKYGPVRYENPDDKPYYII